jgi:predicted Ser/Thr protein kinase
MASDAPEGLCARCLLSAAVKEPSAPSQAQREAPSPEEIARFFPQLEIVELLGRGGMGVVYKARQVQLDRLVALKILPPEAGAEPHFSERFAREARALARLNHPSIVAVYDFGQTEGLFYFLMEYVDGANLRELMRTQQITPKEALVIVPRICEALQFAHDEGIMHRDIKPENILIDKKGRVKIADFGLAKLLGRDPADLSLTQAGMSVGTPRYMAPEQMEHPDEVDHRADIYSLGVVFYEMLTGELPVGRFVAPSQKAEIDVRLDEIVLRSLEHDVDRRYQHVSEVKSDVEDVSGVIGSLPAAMQRVVGRLMGFEYRSKRTLFGWPLVHITHGTDPKTGKRRVARGILAMGEQAYGLIAFGGIAAGGIAFGGLGAGILSFSGLSFGLLAMGGIAIGLLFAYGAAVIAPFAWGGLAVGYVAVGGAAFGVHAAGGNARDPVAAHFLHQWAAPLQLAFFLLLPIVIIVPIFMRAWGERLARKSGSAASTTGTRMSTPPPSSAPGAGGRPDSGRFWRRMAILGVLLVLFVPACTIVGLVVPACAWYRSAQYNGPMIREERPHRGEQENGKGREFVYRLTAPSGHGLKLWMEIWRDGVPVIPSGFTQMFHPAGDGRVDVRVRLSITPGEATSPTAADQMRVEWQLTASGATVSEHAWLPLWSKGLSMSYSTWGLYPRRTAAVGQNAAVLGLFANNETLAVTDSTDETQLRTGNPQAAILLKARFEKISPEKRGAPLWTTGNALEETKQLVQPAAE